MENKIKNLCTLNRLLKKENKQLKRQIAELELIIREYKSNK